MLEAALKTVLAKEVETLVQHTFREVLERKHLLMPRGELLKLLQKRAARLFGELDGLAAHPTIQRFHELLALTYELRTVRLEDSSYIFERAL